MAEDSRYRSLVELTARRSRESGSAYTFLVDGENEAESLDYEALHARARRVAVSLQELVGLAQSPLRERSRLPALLSGDRVLLLYPPGLDFISGFLGCLHAGCIAVPAYPPTPSRLAQSLPRLRAIAANAGISAVLTTTSFLAMTGGMASYAPELAELPWIATDGLPDGSEEAWKDPHAGPEDVALLQYTSGSTDEPKGVVITHGNLLANLHVTYEACFRSARDSVYVGWLPPYHDMGLIGQLLQPLYAGYPCVTMSPLHFLQRPVRWFRALTRYRGTTSASPNFAFDLCTRKITDEEREELDLSHWAVVFNGSEPIHASTLRAFADRFAPCGFRPSAFYPCYGLAESTLMVSGGQGQSGYVTQDVDASSLETGRVTAPRSGSKSRTLVGVGRAMAGHEVAIVDDAGTRMGPNVIGEIHVSGPSVARGYWGGGNDAAFSPWLRTGDLGFLREDGELFVTGRRKDLIILRGRNFLPQDLERVVENAHPALRAGCAAAFAAQANHDEESLVITAEIGPTDDDFEAIIASIQRNLSLEFSIRAAQVVLLKAGTIPKTSSGKLRRFQCRQGHRDGTLDVVHRA